MELPQNWGEPRNPNPILKFYDRILGSSTRKKREEPDDPLIFYFLLLHLFFSHILK